MFFEIKQIKT